MINYRFSTAGLSWSRSSNVEQRTVNEFFEKGEVGFCKKMCIFLQKSHSPLSLLPLTISFTKPFYGLCVHLLQLKFRMAPFASLTELLRVSLPDSLPPFFVIRPSIKNHLFVSKTNPGTISESPAQRGGTFFWRTRQGHIGSIGCRIQFAIRTRIKTFASHECMPLTFFTPALT